jgi:hypothetical protein
MLHTPAYRAAWAWDPPFRAPRAVVVLFFVSNVFLALIPLIPPAPGQRTFESIPYYVRPFFILFHAYVFSSFFSTIRSLTWMQMHVVVTIGASQLGVLYWAIWSVWLPRRNGYALKREWKLQDDGVSRFVFVKVPVAGPP